MPHAQGNRANREISRCRCIHHPKGSALLEDEGSCAVPSAPFAFPPITKKVRCLVTFPGCLGSCPVKCLLMAFIFFFLFLRLPPSLTQEETVVEEITVIYLPTVRELIYMQGRKP